MGKNYTLYISHEKFADEKNKSGLVNRLLDKHYTGAKPTKHLVASETAINTPAQIDEALEAIDEPVVIPIDD